MKKLLLKTLTGKEQTAELSKVVNNERQLHVIVQDGESAVNSEVIERLWRDKRGLVHKREIGWTCINPQVDPEIGKLFKYWAKSDSEIGIAINRYSWNMPRYMRVDHDVEVAEKLILGEPGLTAKYINSWGQSVSLLEYCRAPSKSGPVIGFQVVQLVIDRLFTTDFTLEDLRGQLPIKNKAFAASVKYWEKYWQNGSGIKKDALIAELM